MEPKKVLNVLVVDDEAVIRDFLSRLLALEGLGVKSASGGAEAMEMASKEEFDIVFLDMRMPRMDGVETLEQLKKISPQSKFVMMTGYSVDELLRKLEGKDVEAVITKPFDIKEIVTLLEDYARQKYLEEIISILVVEEDERVCGFFKKLLKGYQVTTVKSGAEALESLQKKHFDLVVSDIELGDINGVELYARIKELSPRTEVILVTGDAKKTEGLIKSCLYQQIKKIID